MALHHAQARGQRQVPERAGEAAEAQPVARAKEQKVVVAGALALFLEGERVAVGEADLIQALEGDGRRLGRLAVEPDRPLAGALRVVDPLDEIPGDAAAVGGVANAG